MKTIIAGSRSITDYESIKIILNDILPALQTTRIVSGGARGVDSLAIQYGKEFSIPVDLYIPKWEQFGKSSGYIRNLEMAENADNLICFWDGSSRGSKHMLEVMEKLNKKLIVLTPDSSGKFSELFRNF